MKWDSYVGKWAGYLITTMTSIQIKTEKKAINDSNSNGNAGHDGMGKASNYWANARGEIVH